MRSQRQITEKPWRVAIPAVGHHVEVAAANVNQDQFRGNARG